VDWGSVLSGIGGYIRDLIAEFCHQFLDWASAYGFVYITPAALSYRNPIILAGAGWSLTAIDGFIAFLLILNAYQFMLHKALGLPSMTLLSTTMPVVIAAIAANIGFLQLLPSVVELSNTMSLSITGTLTLASNGYVTPLGWGTINWAVQPFTVTCFWLLDLLGSVLLVLVDVVRLATFDLTIMFAPLGIMAFASEYLRSFGKFWASLFFTSLFVQPMQTGVMALGVALIANLGHLNPNDPTVCQQYIGAAHNACVTNLGHASVSSSTLVNLPTFLMGFATIYVACKLPQMLWSNALRASVGSVNRDVMTLVNNVAGYLAWRNQGNK
jgi:hypothetical protein